MGVCPGRGVVFILSGEIHDVEVGDIVYVLRESRDTARQLARVRRRSSEQERKPRSPSQRRIGVIRRRSREREARQEKQERQSRSPSCKGSLTLGLGLQHTHRPSLRTTR